MADNQDQFAARLQIHQQVAVEELFKLRILVGSPLIEIRRSGVLQDLQ